jgi:hypothetical protein
MDSSTPLWVPLLIAAVGVAGTLLAALLTQAVTTRREAARAQAEVSRESDRAREEVQREIERAREDVSRETQRWQRQVEREDLARWKQEKRAAYSEFLITASRWERYIEQKRDHRLARNGGAVPIEAEQLSDAVDRAYATVQILGDPSTLDAANAAYHNLVIAMVHLEATHFSVNRVDEGAQLVTQNLADFLAAVRLDLDIDAATPLTA